MFRHKNVHRIRFKNDRYVTCFDSFVNRVGNAVAQVTSNLRKDIVRNFRNERH